MSKLTHVTVEQILPIFQALADGSSSRLRIAESALGEDPKGEHSLVDAETGEQIGNSAEAYAFQAKLTGTMNVLINIYGYVLLRMKRSKYLNDAYKKAAPLLLKLGEGYCASDLLEDWREFFTE